MNVEKTPEARLISIDELDRGIVNLAARINAATFELLVLIRQFDERVGWLKWGLSNCGHSIAIKFSVTNGNKRPFGPSVGRRKHGLYSLYSLQKSGPVVY